MIELNDRTVTNPRSPLSKTVRGRMRREIQLACLESARVIGSSSKSRQQERHQTKRIISSTSSAKQQRDMTKSHVFRNGYFSCLSLELNAITAYLARQDFRPLGVLNSCDISG